MKSFYRICVLRSVNWIAKTFGYPNVRTASLWFKDWYAGQLEELESREILKDSIGSPHWESFVADLKTVSLPQGVKSDVYPSLRGVTEDLRVCYKNTKVVGIHPTIFGQNKSLCKLPRTSALMPFRHGQVRLDDLISVERELRRPQGKVIELEKAIVLDQRQGHFGHWIFEQLPQLRLTSDIEDLVIICNAHDDWKRKLLEDFGVNPECIVGYDGHTGFRVEHLFATNGGQLNLLDLKWLRERAREVYPPTTAGPRRIYVSRQGVGSRMVSNFEVILPILEEFGFEVVQPEKLGVAKSVSVFQDAECIIGPEGSGVRNMVWSENAKVMEIFGHELNYGQWQMAFALGFEYHPYLEPREIPVTKGRWRDVDVSGISVNPELFRQFLRMHL